MQIKFFKKRNMQKIYRDRVRAYICSAAEQYKECRTMPSMIGMSLWLKWRTTAKMIIHHKSKIVEKNKELYIAETFFPHLMNSYWVLIVIKNKLKNDGISATVTGAIEYIRNKIK